MSNRLVIAVATLLAPTLASAGPLDLGLSAGGGASVVYSDPCGFPGEVCTTPRTRLVGPSAVLRGTLGGHHMITPRLGLRWGGALSGLFMTDGSAARDNGSVVTGGGEFGVTFDRFSVDLSSGLSLVHVRADGMAASGATFAFGASAAVLLTDQLSAFARVDLSAMPEGVIGGAFAGAGLSYRL